MLAACRMPEPNAISNAIDYAKFRSRSHDAVIRVYDDAGNVIQTREHAGQFKRTVDCPFMSIRVWMGFPSDYWNATPVNFSDVSTPFRPSASP